MSCLSKQCQLFDWHDDIYAGHLDQFSSPHSFSLSLEFVHRLIDRISEKVQFVVVIGSHPIDDENFSVRVIPFIDSHKTVLRDNFNIHGPGELVGLLKLPQIKINWSKQLSLTQYMKIVDSYVFLFELKYFRL